MALQHKMGWTRRMGRRMLSLVMTAGILLPTLAVAGESTDNTYDFSGYDTVKVACVGASTTEGTKGYSYPAFLQTMLGGRCEVRNFGVGGTSVVTGRDLSYTNTAQYAASLEFRADIVILDIGGNDTQPGIWNGGNNTFAKDYEDLVQSYLNQENHPLVMLSLGNHMHQFNPSQTFWGSDESVTVNHIIPILKDIAQKYQLPTAPLRDTFVGHELEYLDPDDGVHYTAAGYRAQAQLYYDTLAGVATFPADSQRYLWKPTTISFGNSDGEFDGYKVIQWVDGTTGQIQYDSGSLAAAMGIDSGTVVDRLTIAVSYYWQQTNGTNDCLHFNTNDQDGLSAPGIANGKPHDNGYGSFLQYGMKTNRWDTLAVERDNQMLGAPGAGDWMLNIGALAKGNSLYINGFSVTAALADGTVQSTYWGVSQTPDRTALNAAITAANEALSGTQVYAGDGRAALASALKPAVTVNRNTASEAAALDAAAASLQKLVDDLRYNTGDASGDGVVTAEDALMTLQAAAEVVELTPIQSYAADADQSGAVNAEDALLILRHATGQLADFSTKA